MLWLQKKVKDAACESKGILSIGSVRGVPPPHTHTTKLPSPEDPLQYPSRLPFLSTPTSPLTNGSPSMFIAVKSALQLPAKCPR